VSGGRLALPLAAGLAAAVAVFGVVALTTDGGGRSSSERGQGAAAPAEPAAAVPVPAGAVAEGRLLFVRMGCGSCHRLAAVGSTSEFGPDLDARLPSHTRESLTRQILAPQAPGFGMPTDFGERMTDAELQALVSFLLATRRP
jgi:mono/diheme cytochrome c family protein